MKQVGKIWSIIWKDVCNVYDVYLSCPNKLNNNFFFEILQKLNILKQQTILKLAYM